MSIVDNMDYRTRVQNKEEGNKPLYDRMDVDKNLFLLEPYAMLDSDGKPTENVDNMTTNDPQVFANRVISEIGGSIMHSVVTTGKGGKTDEQTSIIERFLDQGIWPAVDAYVQDRDEVIQNIDTFIDEQICIRGRVCARSDIRIEDGELAADGLFMDTRFVAYHYGPKGLAWLSHRTERDAETIGDQFGVSINGKEAEVLTVLTKQEQMIFIAGEKEPTKTIPHNLEYVPAVMEVCGMGCHFSDKGMVKHRGESIYGPVRSLYVDKNQMASVLKTLNTITFMAGLQYEGEQGEQTEAPDVPPWGKRFVISIAKGGGFKTMPVNDIKRASQLLYAIIDACIQRGTLPSVEYGNLTFPLSAIAVSRLGATKDYLYFPRFQAKARFKQRLSEMMIRQYIALGKAYELGTEDHQEKFDPKDLEGAYQIGYIYKRATAEERISKLVEAQAAAQWYSDDTIRRDFLKDDNPEKESNKKWIDRAEATSKSLAKYKMAKALLAEGKEMEAKIVAKEFGWTLRQIRTGKVGPPKKAVEEQPGGSKALMPLEGGGRMPQVPGEEEGVREPTEEREMTRPEGEV